MNVDRSIFSSTGNTVAVDDERRPLHFLEQSQDRSTKLRRYRAARSSEAARPAMRREIALLPPSGSEMRCVSSFDVSGGMIFSVYDPEAAVPTKIVARFP